MRKILLGTTAVVSAVMGAAIMAPQASAQEAPTVRIGGSFRAFYGYTQQSSQSSNTATGLPLTTGNQVQGLPPDSTAATVVGGNGVAGTAIGSSIARQGKHDISTDANIDVIVNGKLANGLTYGAQISFNTGSNGIEGRQVVGQRSSAGKTTLAVDEMYAFIAHPRFGQVRFGDEDGVMGGLMNSGWIQGFGTGGVHGSWESFVVRQAGARTTTAPGGLGDNSKIIYMTPQFFGFDFGASFAPNSNGGEDTGCPNSASSGYCDASVAFTGARNFGVLASGPDQAVRRNEYQLAARWRGNFGGVGMSVTAGYLGSGAARDMSGSGQQYRVFNNLNVWQIGAQASYLGFTFGANFSQGDFNFLWGNVLRGGRPGEQLVVGGQYSAGPFTFGANFVTGLFEGGDRTTYTEVANPAGAALGSILTPTQNRPTAVNQSTTLASQRRWGLGVGANYRIAPGMDLIAEYVYYSVREQGRDLDTNRTGIQSRGFDNVFLLGTRLAF
ncbi:MAG: Porin [Rubritepida sp.]|nr:Porin [Rubritepida sp.]